MASERKGPRKQNLQYSDPGKILELVTELNVDTCVEMQTIINEYLRRECEAEFALQIIAHTDRMEAYVEAVGNKALNKKNKFSRSQKYSDILKSNSEETELFVNLDPELKAFLTPYLPKEMPKRRVVLIPFVDKPFSLIVLVVSPRVMEETATALIQECFMFSWPTLKKAIVLDYECTMKQKCQQLLRVARRLFTQVASLDTLMQIAMEQAKALTKAEYCSVKLIDVEKMEMTESIYKKDRKDSEKEQRRFPMNKGIIGRVVNTGMLINTRSVKDHPEFDPNIDNLPGVEARQMLCFPIREQQGIIGVGQLINKISDPYFDAMDEEMALAFSIYCGVCIVHSVVYTKVQEAHIRNALANELVMYHMKVADAEVHRLLECNGFHNHPHFNSLHFNQRALPLRELPCYVLKMFMELGFDKKFNLKIEKLARFVLHVKKGYRDVPYHSFLHAFNVAQWAYAAMVNFKLMSQGYMTELQGLVYLIAGLSHDLDHRGTTNSFQILGKTTLAALYSSEGSVMERHHLAQAMCILNTEGCDILESLPRRDYDRALMLLRDYILATDLATYFKNLGEYRMIADEFQKGNRMHHSALLCLLMNAADLSDQLKDWGCVKKTAAAVLTEFFRQGDEEKSRGDLPAMMMDRDKCVIPELEVQFLKTICVPLYTIIGKIVPKADACVKILENHIERWDAAMSIFAEVPTTAGLTVLLSPELDKMIEQSMKDKQERLRLEAEAEAAAEAEKAE